jgi:hypothetical protein
MYTLNQLVTNALDRALKNRHMWLVIADPVVVAVDLKETTGTFRLAMIEDMLEPIREWQSRNNHEHINCGHGNCQVCEPCGDCFEENRLTVASQVNELLQIYPI